jgi:hypothetical protein
MLLSLLAWLGRVLLAAGRRLHHAHNSLQRAAALLQT